MTSRSRSARTIAVAWAATLATAGVFLVVGTLLDDALEGRTPGAEPLVLGLALAVVAGIAQGWVVREGAHRQADIESEARRAVVRTVTDLGPAALVGERTGRIVSTATDAGERVGINRGTFVAPAIASVTSPLIVLVVVAVMLDVRTALLLLPAVPLAPVVVGGFQRLFQRSSTDYRKASRRLAASFLDSIQGLTTLRLLGAGERRALELAAAAERVRRAVMRMLLGNQLIILVADTVFWMGFVGLAAWLATLGVRDGALTPGEGFALVLLATLLLDPLDRIGQFFYIGMAGRAAGKEIAAFCAREPLVADPSDAGRTADVEEAGIAVELDAVTFAYPDGTPVLDGARLTVAPGERVALVGRSGEGKSTIADLLAGTWLPAAGEVRLGGVATSDLPRAEVRRLVATVSQSTYLFTGTLAENLRLAAPDATDDVLWAALEVAHLAGDVRAMPRGLATPVGERGLSLSGGQAQRLAIARAVLRDAPLLVLDEPTAQIDLASEAEVTAALAAASVGRTVLTITHRPSAVRPGDRVVRLAAGQIDDAVRVDAAGATPAPTEEGRA